MGRKVPVKKANPVLQKAWNEGYHAGIKQGHKEAARVFAYKFELLQEANGIGPKTMRKIIDSMELPVVEVEDGKS